MVTVTVEIFSSDCREMSVCLPSKHYRRIHHILQYIGSFGTEFSLPRKKLCNRCWRLTFLNSPYASSYFYNYCLCVKIVLLQIEYQRSFPIWMSTASTCHTWYKNYRGNLAWPSISVLSVSKSAISASFSLQWDYVLYCFLWVEDEIPQPLFSPWSFQGVMVWRKRFAAGFS